MGGENMLRRTSLHRGWQFAGSSWEAQGKLGYAFLEWLPASVPGHVHLDLIDNGVIAHPFERMHEMGCQWVDESDWSYKTSFAWQPSSPSSKRVLRFEGLDTVCTVRLNGEVVAEHDNMFVPLEIDVSERLRAGTNELRVDFRSAVRVGQERQAAWMAEQGLANEIERLLERSFVRKAQYMFGWDWGPRLVSCGIWRPVELLEYAARLTDVDVVQQHLPDGSVKLALASRIEGEARVVHLLEGEGILLGDGEIELEDPELWQPVGFGDPHLYTLRSYACPPNVELGALPQDGLGARLALEAMAFDEKVTRIGLRTLKLLRQKDEHGESFEFVVNGQRIWVMGANWIPDHSLPATVSAGQYRTRIEAALAAGMNMLRIWGGGLYENCEFYDLCDELGVLVWQDFAFACAYYPDTGDWPEVVRREAEANVRRLRGHASLALWCGNNENLTMWQQKWGDKNKQPPRYFGEVLYEKVLPGVVAALDPATPYIATSPIGGDDANGGLFGDQHYWDVWHGRGDWQFYRDSTARFASEYGFASAPSLVAWREVLGPDAELKRPGSALGPIVRWHDKTLKGFETFRGYVHLHYPESTEIESWTYYSQLNQRDAMRAAIEHYRRGELCRGSLIWQLNDCWPVQSWALIDNHGQPKAAWFELSRLHAPLLVSALRDGNRLELWASYDNVPPDHAIEGELVVRATDLDTGAERERWSAAVALKSGEHRRLLEIDVSALPPRRSLLVAALGGATATVLLDEPKHLELGPAAPLDVSLHGDGELVLESPTPLVDLCLWDAAGTAAFASNTLTLAAPGRLSTGYSGSGHGLRARSLAGEHELFVTRSRLG
jgi:beta-mannosidase